ncbi:MAG: DoxX family protein [Candidatus Hydrogenedentes bacterium]|nr:DoxX family protein [Candidatus Hydrogenedentota bacterium]
MSMNARMGTGKWVVTLVRCAVGWHFLFEGLSKVAAGDWSARGYLQGAAGPLAGLYHGLASSDPLLGMVDALNMYGLTVIGLALFLGVFVRLASVSAILMLLLYYFAYPPFAGVPYPPTEGTLFLVNKNVIEALVLVLLLVSGERGYGVHGLAALLRRPAADGPEAEPVNARREALKHMAVFPLLGLLGYGGARQYKSIEVDGFSGATQKLVVPTVADLAGELPKGRLGNFEISRLVMGGNMIGGWAHSRDLIYVPALSMAYNTESKIFETLQLAEAAGINAINIGFPSNPVLKKYKQVTGSKIVVISQVAPTMGKDDYFGEINTAMDCGADILQVQGNWIDVLSRDNKFDVIEKLMDKIRGEGYVAGMGAHSVEGLILCEERGIIPDYYMKTLHHDQYWSAHPRENRHSYEVMGGNSDDHNKFHDNMFCAFPEKDTEFVERVKKPVMGFKVLAAGAIHPHDGFNWALQHGADFICVGMFDFQVVQNVNTMIKVLADLKDRKREWYA